MPGPIFRASPGIHEGEGAGISACSLERVLQPRQELLLLELLLRVLLQELWFLQPVECSPREPIFSALKEGCEA